MSVKSKGSRRTWRDRDDAPEVTGKWVAEADLYRGKRLVHHVRPDPSSDRIERPETSHRPTRRRNV